jgi:hypothetical protein
MSLRERLQTRKQALQVTRKASKLLGVRSGVFLRKLRAEDADAQMAFVMAAEEVGDFDPDQLMAILEMILEFIAMLAEIFNW